MSVSRDLGGLWDHPPPDPRTRIQNNPTLLFSWWCTLFSAVIISMRLIGRKTRSSTLFREDWIMMMALLPLFLRMGFVHVVLLYGTNNIRTEGYEFTAEDVARRELGSRLVLASRIFYALYIWTSKLTVSEFLKRITIRMWRKSWELTLHGIRIFLAVTFVAVVIATLTECQPFDHYWQVIPDPGPQCREGFAQLITMGTCDIITDILLVAFPIPIVLRSGQTWKRKVQLGSLFSLSIILIAITATRMPEVLRSGGRQQYRTVWASCEILASTAVSNAVILGSFVRDKGTKRNKFRNRATSVSNSLEAGPPTRHGPQTAHHGSGSDEDLFRTLGMRVPQHLQSHTPTSPRPASAAPPGHKSASRKHPRSPPPLPPLDTDILNNPTTTHTRSDSAGATSTLSPQRTNVSFADVGGLLDPFVSPSPSTPTKPSSSSTPNVPSSATAEPAVHTLDFAPPPRLRSRDETQAVAGAAAQRPPATTATGPANTTTSNDNEEDEDDEDDDASDGDNVSALGVLPPARRQMGFLEFMRGEDAAQGARQGRHRSARPAPEGEEMRGGMQLSDVGGLLGGATAAAAAAATTRGGETVDRGDAGGLRDVGGLLGAAAAEEGEKARR